MNMFIKEKLCKNILISGTPRKVQNKLTAVSFSENLLHLLMPYTKEPIQDLIQKNQSIK